MKIALIFLLAFSIQVAISGKATLSGSAGTMPPAVVLAGYDILLGAGQSNKQHGGPFDAGLDISDSRIYSIYNTSGTPGTLSPASANDPLDYGVDPPDTGFIGHDVHFAKDYYIANGALPAPRKVIIVPYAKGGSVLSNTLQWGGDGPLTAVTTLPGSLLETSVTRVNSALALTGTNTVKAILWHQGESEYIAFGNSWNGGLYASRWWLLRALSYFRQHLGNTIPIVVGRCSAYSIDVGQGVYNANGLIMDGIIQATVNRMKYIGLMDSQSPTSLGGSDVHFTAPEQRIIAGRYWIGYQAALTNTLSSPTTWDTLDYPQFSLGYPAGFTLSNSNLDVSGDSHSGWKTMWATNPKTTGKVYVEFKVSAITSNINLGYIGFSNSDKGFDTQIGGGGSNGPSVKSAGMWDSNGQAVGGYTQVWNGNQGDRALNDIIMLALDITGGKAWIGKNGTWSNSGNPVAGTNPWVTGLVDGEMHFLAVSIYTGTGNTWRLQTTTANQTYAAPSGYTPWN